MSKTISITVKIKAGKRTPVEVWASHYEGRELEFVNGRKLTEERLAAWIVQELDKELKIVEKLEG